MHKELQISGGFKDNCAAFFQVDMGRIVARATRRGVIEVCFSPLNLSKKTVMEQLPKLAVSVLFEASWRSTPNRNFSPAVQWPKGASPDSVSSPVHLEQQPLSCSSTCPLLVAPRPPQHVLPHLLMPPSCHCPLRLPCLLAPPTIRSWMVSTSWLYQHHQY